MAFTAFTPVTANSIENLAVALEAALPAEPIGPPIRTGENGAEYACIVGTGTPAGTPTVLNALDVTAGTGEASKALVLDAGEDLVLPATGVLTYGVLKDPAGTTLGATAAEINLAADVSAQTETLTADGAISVVKRFTKLADTGTGAYTLAAPDASMVGAVKVIEMTTDNGDCTLALTNVTGHTTETATFNDVGDNLVLVGGAAGKWIYVAATATLA
jgi:hypothetical protein